MGTKEELLNVIKCVRIEEAKKTAPSLVAAVMMIAGSSSSRWDREGTVSTWSDGKGKMVHRRFSIDKAGAISWCGGRIEEPTFIRHITDALVKGAILTIGSYAAALDGNWHGLNKEQASIVGYTAAWPEAKDQSENFRERLLSMAATEL
jgi:hypothetical protein